MTIVRIWRCVTFASEAEQYLEYLNKFLIPACQTAEGSEGLCVMRRLESELAHFLFLSFWTSEMALANFAGCTAREYEVVNPSPEERRLLIAFESTARHYEVVQISETVNSITAISVTSNKLLQKQVR